MKPPCFITLAFGLPMPANCPAATTQLIKNETALAQAQVKKRMETSERHHYPNTA